MEDFYLDNETQIIDGKFVVMEILREICIFQEEQ